MNAIPTAFWTYIAGLKAHDVEQIGRTVSDALTCVTPARTLNKEQFLQMLRALYAGFPDWHDDHDAPEWQENMIAVRWRQGGTHTAELWKQTCKLGASLFASGRNDRVGRATHFSRRCRWRAPAPARQTRRPRNV